MMPTPSLDHLDAAAVEADRLVAAVPPGRWGDPTPCDGWDLRALVGHLTAGHDLVAAGLRGEEPADADAAADGGDGPAAAHRASVDGLLAAVRAPGALDRMVSIPFGTVPAAMALHIRLVELLVHGWDVARASGGAPRFPDAAVDQALAFSHATLAELPPERRPFAAPHPVADDAPAIDRLVALLGRDPSA